MPKIPLDYNNTVIYKICCLDLLIKDIYVGHTTNFNKRKNNHKKSVSSDNPVYVYQFIRKHGGWDNWEMVEIEKYSCNDSNEAHKRERYWLETLCATLNCVNPYATKDEKELQKKIWYNHNKNEILSKKKENYVENKEEILKYQKEYAQLHKEEIKEYQKEYNEQNKEQISETSKIYRETHKEEIKQTMKKWHEENKDKIKEKKAKNVVCECGNEFTLGNQSKHLKTKTHIAYQNALCGIIEEPKPKLSEAEIKERNKLKQQEYRVKHFEQIKENKKIYNDSHKEQNKEQKLKYYQEHKEHIIEQNKKYVEENKEKITKRRTKYYQENKDKIMEKQKELFVCECGSKLRRGGASEHCKSVKHQTFLENNKKEKTVVTIKL